MVGHGKKSWPMSCLRTCTRAFALQRAKFTKGYGQMGKVSAPSSQRAFLEEDALQRGRLCPRVWTWPMKCGRLPRKHRVRIEEFKIAGLHDVLDALKTLPPATEQKCVAASLADHRNRDAAAPSIVRRPGPPGDVQRIQSLPEPAEVAALPRGPSAVDPGRRAICTRCWRQTWMENMEASLADGRR